LQVNGTVLGLSWNSLGKAVTSFYLKEKSHASTTIYTSKACMDIIVRNSLSWNQSISELNWEGNKIRF